MSSTPNNVILVNEGEESEESFNPKVVKKKKPLALILQKNFFSLQKNDDVTNRKLC